MSVIAFRPRVAPGGTADATGRAVLHGTFRTPRGGAGRMTGWLRVQRLVVVPRGASVTAVFTGELREDDGTLVGVDSRRATVTADLVQDHDGVRPWVRAFGLDLMGITVEVGAFPLDLATAFPRPEHEPAPRSWTRQPPAGSEP